MSTQTLPAIAKLDANDPTNPYKKDYYFIPGSEVPGSEELEQVTYTAQFLMTGFWFWLGIDQLAHVILNIIFALFLAFILDVIF